MRIDGLMLNAISKQIDTAFDEKDESTLQKSVDEINQLFIDENPNSISELILYYNLQERYYYIHRVVEENLQVDTLEILIKKDAYKHQKELPKNFERTITPASLARKAVEMFKDEYLLDFINVEEIDNM